MRAACVLLVVGACAEPTTTALFAVPSGPPPADGDFYALPFPNDIYRKNGTLDLATFPTNGQLVDLYRKSAQELDGFGLNQAIYARFDRELDPTSVPDPAASVEPTAAVYLVNVDPASPMRGQRTPILAKFRAKGTQTLGIDHVVARPYPGFGLAEGTTYALVLTTRLRGDTGGDVVAPQSFKDVLADKGDPEIQAAYAPLLAWLDEPGDDERDDVVSAAVFTTQHATTIMPAIRKAVFAAPAPVASNLMSFDTKPEFKSFTGDYTAPNFQMGDVPYRNPPSGQIVVGTDGAAVVQRMEKMRFAMTVPNTPVPAGGFPIAIYAHGTGGDYSTFIEDGTAAALTAEGIAVISTDQVLHGPRNPGGNPEIDFFNFANPYAMRDNVLQGAADAFAQLRLALGLSIVDGTRTIKVNPAKVFFFGHSQGGSTGPGFVAFEPSLSGAVMSGTGGLYYIGVLHKTQPLDIPGLVATLVRDDPIDEDNPSLAMAQMWLERGDGANYAPLMVRNPVVAGKPRNIFQTEGFTDTYSPNLSIEAFATALGGDLVQLPDEKDVEGLTLRGRATMATPFSNNVNGVTAVLAQYKAPAGDDGHFVVFDVPSAKQQAASFLGSLARTGTATVVAPQ
jgi:predicted esterase